MLFFGIQNRTFRLILATIFVVLTLIFVVVIYRDYFIDNPYVAVPTYRETKAFNREGDFSDFAMISAIEFLVLTAVLLPYSFSRFYWIRLLFLQILFVVWLFLLHMMRGSGSSNSRVAGFHALYLLIVNAVIFILFIASIVAEIVAKRKSEIQNDGTNAA